MIQLFVEIQSLHLDHNGKCYRFVKVERGAIAVCIWDTMDVFNKNMNEQLRRVVHCTDMTRTLLRFQVNFHSK